MRSPKEMRIIEIDITNACVHQCANCTRFCGHHEKPFFMSFDKFKQAVDSLDEFEGMVGMIGGEPTLHPEFERFTDYIREKRTQRLTYFRGGPIEDMQFHIITTVNKGRTSESRAVLLSSLSSSYYKHYEAINDTFEYQILNDHSSDSLHQALLMSRGELAIPDNEWKKKRDDCWIQNTWSATITPKGAFFCEVAGSLDMLMNGPGGWTVEPGWWKREPQDFVDQLHWCELCSGCLDVPKRLAHDERDDVTPGMYEKLKKLKSPKVLSERVIVRNPKDYEKYREPTFENGSEYIEAGGHIRISSDNDSLYPKNIDFFLMNTWKDELKHRCPKDWIIIVPEKSFCQKKKENIENYFKKKIWNPGCLYIIDENIYALNVKGRCVRDAIDFPTIIGDDIKDLYPVEKVIYLSMEDRLVSILGGDNKEALERGSRVNKRILVYGAGEVGKAVIKQLHYIGISDFDVVVKKKNGDAMLEGHLIHNLSDFADETENVLVIIAVGRMLYKEVLLELDSVGIHNYRFIA